MYAPVAAPSVLALTIMARAARRETRIQSISVALQAENPMVFAKLAAGEVRRRSCPRPCCPAREVVSRRARRQPAGQRGFSAVCGFVAALAEAGARVDAANQWRQTPLWQAAGRRDQGNTEIAHILVAAGADFTHADINGNTPLLRAAYVGHRPMVAYLIELGGDPSARNARGETPLWRAVSQKHVETVRVLLAGGADPNTGVGGVTPLEHALKHTGDGTQGAMVALLRANGATGYRRYAASAARHASCSRAAARSAAPARMAASSAPRCAPPAPGGRA